MTGEQNITTKDNGNQTPWISSTCNRRYNGFSSPSIIIKKRSFSIGDKKWQKTTHQ